MLVIKVQPKHSMVILGFVSPPGSGVASVDNWRGEYSCIRVQRPYEQWISKEISEAKYDL